MGAGPAARYRGAEQLDQRGGCAAGVEALHEVSNSRRAALWSYGTILAE